MGHHAISFAPFKANSMYSKRQKHSNSNKSKRQIHTNSQSIVSRCQSLSAPPLNKPSTLGWCADFAQLTRNTGFIDINGICADSTGTDTKFAGDSVVDLALGVTAGHEDGITGGTHYCLL
jgi:hypothetical protein